MEKTKGIILAGGKATRLYPITKAVCKQLLPIYDKPMIYYPLSVLMLAGIRDVLIISTLEAIPQFQNLLGDGKHLGLTISYTVQENPRGLADAFIVGEAFIGKNHVCLVLGDNVFYGDALQTQLKKAIHYPGAYIFAYSVKDPQRYGVVTFDEKENVLLVEEKPKRPKSNWAITGLYFFDNRVIKIAKEVKPSPRGELEITDVINAYLKLKALKVIALGRGYAWLDTGTHDSLIEASAFIKIIEDRQGLKIGCVEEIGYRKGFISKAQLKSLANQCTASYGDYLREIVRK